MPIPDDGTGWPGLLARILLGSAVVVLSGGLGRLFARSALSGLSRLAWDTACGLPIFIGILLVAGQIPGGFAFAPLVGVTVLCLIGALLLARFGARGPGDEAAAPWAGAARWIVLVILAVTLVAGLAWDRVPSVFFDTLAYHYAQPNLWLVDGRIAPATWSLHSWFPPGMSVLYGLGLATAGEPAAADANLLVGLLLLALTADLARRLWGSAAAAVAVGLLLSLPITIHALGIPAADLGHGMFALGSLGAGLLAWKGRDPSWLRRASLLAGGALQTKWLGALVPLALFVVVLLVLDRGRPRRAAVFAAAPLALILPWLVANALVVGNPVAPALSSLLPTRGLAPGGAAAFEIDARGGLPGLEDLRLLGPRLVEGDADADAFYPTPAWGWVPVLLLPAGLLMLRGDVWARRVVYVALATWIVWLLTFRWERFLVATSALLAAACAGLIVGLWRLGGGMRVLPLAGLVLGGLAGVRAILSVLSFTGGEAVLLGRMEPRAFVERAIPVLRLFDRAGSILDPAAHRILLVGEDRHHRLAIPHAAPSVFNRHPLAELLAAGDTPGQASSTLRELGFTHVIVDPAGLLSSAGRYPSLALFRERPDRLEDYLRSLGEPLDSEGGIGLFNLAVPEPGPPGDRR